MTQRDEEDNSMHANNIDINMYYTLEIIDYLKELGCKVPVLLYSDVEED